MGRAGVASYRMDVLLRPPLDRIAVRNGPGRLGAECRPGRRSELYHRPQLKGQAGDDLDMFLTHDAGGATGVSGFISYDFCRLAGRVPRPSITFLFQGASMRCFVSSSIDLGSRLR
jgi:hypothetical protein